MATDKETVFADGFFFKRNDNAPDFVIGSLSLKVSKVIDFIGMHEKDGWLNLSVKKSRKGGFYVELDTYVSKSSVENEPEEIPNDSSEDSNDNTGQLPDIDGDGLPF